MLKKCIYIFLLCYGQSILCQETTFHRGKIIDSIQISKESDESYALYLPSDFVNTELSPIVFIFDPVARGKIGIHPFIKAAEKYGYILVCSNSSKNGSFEKNIEIANRLFEKVFSQFSINPKRIYTAGFSGGARLASTIAVLTKQIQGVIACGAGFSSYQIGFPDAMDFSYAAIVGDEDMNLLEMHKARNYISKFKVSNELFVYEMNHKWPTQEQVLIAFDWLELEAYRKGLVPTDKTKIETTYIDYHTRAKKLEENEKLLYAIDDYQRIIKNFDPYFELDSITTTIDRLHKNKSVRKEKKELKSIFDREDNLRNMFVMRFRKDLITKNINFKWWKSEIKKLKKEETSATFNKKKMLKRLLYSVFAIAIETVNVGPKVSTIEQKIFCYDICILVYPKYPLPYFKQIENFLGINEKSKALDYLERLIDNGYTNMNALKTNVIFQSLKNDERFIELTKDKF